MLSPDASSRERSPYRKDELSLAAKRRFLIEFWAKRDDIKSTPENEYRMAFYEKVGYANAHYGARFVAGWKTALGKIYTKYGAPDDSLASRMAGRGVQTMVWRMTHGKARWFIFGDRSNNGSWQLLRTSEATESGFPGWLALVTVEQARIIAQWLALPVNFFDKEQ